ncbi:MAG: hypothetical protein ABII90_08420 [Bacteroidota bacterium]
MNIYKEILKQNIPKLLNLYDLDPSSITYGNGDRLFWGWKVSDFTNATMQGGVNSLAIAIKLDIVDNKEFILKVIDGAIKAIDSVKDKKGALQEAYPSEHSFCVTALVAFDVLSAIKHLNNEISSEKKNEYLGIIKPLITFITETDEDHAIISNHLATAVAAIILWNRLYNDNNYRYKKLLDIIYKNQSKEGWYKEYDGADPGYETLCLYYLSSAFYNSNNGLDDISDSQKSIHTHVNTKEETGKIKLKESIIKSATFLKHFIHPDHTIGGLYGSRNTEVYYPGGIIALSNLSNDFALIAKELEKGIINSNHLLPQNIDSGNYIPYINSYAYAALHYDKNKDIINSGTEQTVFENTFEKDFKEAGIFLKSSKNYFVIISYKKGGTLKVFNKKNNKIDIEDGGIYGELKDGTKFSSQAFVDAKSFNNYEIRVNFYKLNNAYPTPSSFIILRILAFTFFKSLTIGKFFKKYIVRKLMRSKKRVNGRGIRKFIFEEEKIFVEESIITPRNLKFIKHIGKFRAIHMASSGYFLKQILEEPVKSQIVEFNNVNSKI